MIEGAVFLHSEGAVFLHSPGSLVFPTGKPLRKGEGNSRRASQPKTCRLARLEASKRRPGGELRAESYQPAR